MSAPLFPFDQPLVLSQSTPDLPAPDLPAPDLPGGDSSGAPDASAAASGLCAGDFHDRWDQARQVAHLGEVALGELLAILQDDAQDWEARWFAARTLGDLKHPGVITALVETFAATPDNDLRQAIAAALTQIGPAAIAALGQQLDQLDLRPVAVQALARIHHPATLPLLLEAVDDERSAVRATALEALGTFADRATLPIMQQGLQDPSAAVRAAAIRGLLSLRAHIDLTQLAAALTPLLCDRNLSIAQQAAYALGRLPLAAAAVPLLQLLQADDPPAGLQVCAVQALTWQNTAAALDGLIQAWPVLGEQSRLALLQGLASLDSHLREQATPALLDWLGALPTTPAHSTLRRHLVLALGQLGSPAMAPELQVLLHDPDPGVQIHAEAALRQLQPQLTQA